MKRRLFGWLLTVVCLASSSGADAGYSALFIFGDSLSDSGNNAILFDALGASQIPPLPPGTLRTQVLPPTVTNSLIPTYPYAVSNEYTNGQVWAQTFASSLGLNLAPSLSNPPLPPPGGIDYAFGGARTSAPSPTPSLEDQALVFLSQYPTNLGGAPSDALYVVEGGGDNARDALPIIGPQIISTCTNPVTFQGCAKAIIQPTADAYAGDMKTIINELEADGAKHIVVWNIPDIGFAPAILSDGPLVSELATLLASQMNADLLKQIGSDPDVALFDIFTLVDEVVKDKGAFGINLSNVTDACAANQACDPSTYLFWDGIHPTSAGDMIISNAMIAFVPEPATLALLGLAFAGIGLARRRKLN